MTLHDFVQNYNLHDSFFEGIEYFAENQTVKMQINFAFWMQDGYKDGEPETGVIEVRFYGVTEYMCPPEFDCEQLGILQTEEINDGVKFMLCNDVTDDFAEITINAKTVEVAVMQ